MLPLIDGRYSTTIGTDYINPVMSGECLLDDVDKAAGYKGGNKYMLNVELSIS